MIWCFCRLESVMTLLQVRERLASNLLTSYRDHSFVKSLRIFLFLVNEMISNTSNRKLICSVTLRFWPSRFFLSVNILSTLRHPLLSQHFRILWADYVYRSTVNPYFLLILLIFIPFTSSSFFLCLDELIWVCLWEVVIVRTNTSEFFSP